MKIKLAIDTESTTWAKGNPFARRNHLCCVSLRKNDTPSICLPWEYGRSPVTADTISSITDAIERADLLIFFNAKHDLHWLRRCGIIDHYRDLRIWDCQVAQFIIRNQSERYPSLNSSCAFFALGQKLDVIEKEYWNKGVDTDGVPWDILSQYAMVDVDLTWELYKKQQEYLADKPALLRLIKLSCMDTLILAEMEFNGLVYDTCESLSRAEQKQQERSAIEQQLTQLVGVPCNWNSGDHTSAVLYGGVVRYVEEIPYLHQYKTGPYAGQTKERIKHNKIETTLPRLVEPLPNSELKKPGYWSTDDSTLAQLRATGVAKRVVGLITKRNKLERLISTYYLGIPKTMEEKDWPEGELHGQFNQCVVVTGRTSSSSPNLQNMAPEVDELIKTRFN